jgi:hypothetical protein
VAWKTIYTNLADEFGGKQPKADWSRDGRERQEKRLITSLP